MAGHRQTPPKMPMDEEANAHPQPNSRLHHEGAPRFLSEEENWEHDDIELCRAGIIIYSIWVNPSFLEFCQEPRGGFQERQPDNTWPCSEPRDEPEDDPESEQVQPIKASVITQVFHVPLEERKYKDMNQFGEGEQAKICLDIMRKTGAHLELSLAKDQGLSIVVSGKAEAVTKARKQIVARLQTRASATVAIPKEHHCFVIGKKGERLQDLKLKTATKMQVPRPDDPSNQIKISGTKEGIEKARHEILLISAEQDKRAVERLDVEQVYHPFIAGPYNKLVRELMQDTGTRIDIPPPSVNKAEIVFSGEKEQLAQAVARVKKIYEEKKKKTTTLAVEVKKSQHKYVIGPKGNSLQEILEKTGVSVEIPATDRSSGTVILRGEPEKLGQALTDVYAKANSFTVSSVSAPSWLHRFIIGKKGQNLAKITQQMQLQGPKNEVEKCTEYMQKMVADLVENSFSISVPICKQFHKNIIVKGGANIKKIRKESNTKIDLPAKNSNSETIVITGKRANCEAAHHRILATQKELANSTEVEVSIPSKLHSSLIGAKGRFVRSIVEDCGGVHIHFPTKGSGSDSVIIRGPAQGVEKAKKELLHL
ncbi:LOW QUALITY PROTEIN: vigilin-like [Falco biarmicus]|uniref:LOW QUALITY PROTEIN: vigilin-like n=1 Tax=Falco biarmicus TaxID=345155 RepID=UPI0024BD0D6A|nr:LOW QUALITY PROTEIN: vigilin-like [Falco biarmicus]